MADLDQSAVLFGRERFKEQNAPTERYRNRFLAEAMVNLGMIDTIGSGIRRMFTFQRKRCFPLPDYDLSQPGQVRVRIHGRVLDEKYTRLLIHRTDLNLFDVVALDKVQKGNARRLSDSEFKTLKRQNLVEGRRPNLRVSAEIVTTTETIEDYLIADIPRQSGIICRKAGRRGEAARADSGPGSARQVGWAG